METEPNNPQEGQATQNNESLTPDPIQPSSDSGVIPEKIQSDAKFAAQVTAQEEKDRNRIAELMGRLAVVYTLEHKPVSAEPVTKPVEKSLKIEPTQFGVAHVPGENLPAEHPLNQRELFSYIKEGPKFTDILTDTKERDNSLSSQDREAYPVPPPNRFTERLGLTDLNTFLDSTIQLASQTGNKEIEETAQVFKRDLVYIGETELQEALHGLASGIVSSAENGENVYLYVGGVRSERYVALRILEEVDQLTAENPQLRQSIHLSERASEIARGLKNVGGRGKVIVADDFSVSGTRIDAFATNAFRSLVQVGFSPEEASRRIEINLVADKPNREEGHKIKSYFSGEKYDYPVKTVAYFGVPESLKSDGKWNVFTGMSVTGSHSSTDYGYDNVLEEFRKFQIDNGIVPKMPLLHNVTRPYDMEDYSGGYMEEHRSNFYKDKQLQARWNMIMHKYQLS